MIIVILVLLILVTGLLEAYTMNFQKTTLDLGGKMAPDNPRLFQDAITPKGQTIRNILYPILILGILIYGLFFYKWYLAIIFVVITFFIVTSVFKIVLPKIGSNFYKDKIKKDLLKRKAYFEKTRDTAGIFAINGVLKKLENIK